VRILYIDIDSLRPDHLGCYGYHRDTSPNIDQIAQSATRFENVYISDAPCLPSRTALWSGRTGFHTGVVDHGGTAAQPFIEGANRRVRDKFHDAGWMQTFRKAGLKTATISSFADRHAAWHWYAGYDEFINPGGRGNDRADEVFPLANDWLNRNGKADNWFLHVNFWDPHTPYRTPLKYGNPFENDGIPAWITEDVHQRCWQGYGPHSAQEPNGYTTTSNPLYPRVPAQLDTMETVKQWIDGYDTGIHYTDMHVGRIMDTLADLNILDDTVIMISADHGENQGELNVWGDHQTAGAITCRVPLIVKWPGIAEIERVDRDLHYHFDWAATMIELVGQDVPEIWDGVPFTQSFKSGDEDGRKYLVTSQGAWSCQRGIRFNHDGDSYLCLVSYHDGFKMVDPVMLFNLTQDPHEQHNLVDRQPILRDHALALLTEWQQHMMQTSEYDVDPLMTVLRENGPSYCQGMLPEYLERLRATGRGHHADKLEKIHPNAAAGGVPKLHGG